MDAASDSHAAEKLSIRIELNQCTYYVRKVFTLNLSFAYGGQERHNRQYHT